MTSVATKHPKKKRRLDDVPDNQSLPGPSKEVLPLVAPMLVKRNSRDPNRGMYPSPKGKYKKSNTSSSMPPGFVKASELRKKVVLAKEKMPESVLSIHSNESVQRVAPVEGAASVQGPAPLVNPATGFNDTCDSKNTGKVFNSHMKKVRHKTKFAHSNTTNKITKFFKNSTSTKQWTPKVQSNAKTTPSDLGKDSPGTSGWKEKNKKMSDKLKDFNNEHFFQRYRYCYGLLDNESNIEDRVDYFKLLPTHIIETILCQIPMVDLMACRTVCTRWHEIIDDSKFMEWKKLYYRYKKECSKVLSGQKKKLASVINAQGYSTMEDCIGALMKYMAKGFNRLPSSDMRQLLMQNPKGELADQVLAERFPEFTGKDSRVWCQFALAVLLCETVWDIFSIYRSLFTSKSACPRPDVTDAMYCIATFLLHFLSTEGMNCGLHYRLYYCLYLIENNIPKSQREKLKIVQGIPGQQCMPSYSKTDSSFMTHEQIRILNHQFDMNQKIRIIALAGTGKTTTLLQLSRLYPQIKFLNLVFNKSVSDEARKKFPSNVTCKTAHSLAYSVVGKLLRHKLTSTLRPYDLLGHLKHNEDHIQIYAYANLVLTTINNFTVSSTNVMCLEHVPTHDFNNKELSFLNQDRILMDAYKIWQKMIDEKDPFKITHDVYLKLYHLKEPKLDKYQCIMVDEAQDCNPVILDIVLSQTMPVIFVGDPYQQIYKFRGAQNALQNITATHTYYLTKSFRFGPEIAYIASCVLELMLNARSTTIVGNTKDSFVSGKVGGQYAVISRTNIMLFNEALRMIVFKRLKRNEPTAISATFAGGFNSYGFDQISDIYKLKTLSRGEREVSDKFISRFKSYSDLVNYARYSNDTDLLSKIEIVNQHDHNISKFISILRDKCSYPMDVANVVFSTAHKAKGLEFDTVCLTDDYPIPVIPASAESREEANILYVALTRARRFLLIPEKVKKILYKAHEKFEYPVATKSILQDNAALNCVSCKDAFTPHAVLTMIRRKMIMASDREITEGPLCLKCSTDPYMRPDIHLNSLVMYLDPTSDNYHRFMSSIVGPLPGDPPIVHDRFSEFHNAERVFVINLNVNVNI